MPVTLQAPPGDMDKPTPDAVPEQSEILRRLTALQARDERLVTDRRTALLLAALIARLARAYRQDRDQLLRANLSLQGELDAAAVRERVTAAQVDALAREVVETQGARRDLAARHAELTAENSRLRAGPELGESGSAPKLARGRWRR
jgi:hypothetical protein